jgi:hypothetical protein
VPGRIKDFIAMPRPNGYQSLHTSVVSERDFPSRCRSGPRRCTGSPRRASRPTGSTRRGGRRRPATSSTSVWLRQLLEWQQEVRDPQEFIQNLKIELYPEEVYIFTPKGEVKALPRGATPIDFAYAVHTDVGTSASARGSTARWCRSATRLKNGDIVEIVTTAGHKPSRDWLNFVVTSRARNKIKHYIQGEEKRAAIELGRKLFEKEARRFDVNLKDLLASEKLEKVAGEYGVGSVDDLFAAIGYGKLAPGTVLIASWPAPELKEKPPDTALTAVVRRVLGTGEEKIKVRGVRRPAGVPRALLQSRSAASDRRLHHARQGRVGPLGELPQRAEPALRPRATHRRRVGQGRRQTAPYTVQADHASRGPERHPRRREREGRRHQHQHPERGGDNTDEQRGRIDMTVEISDLKHLAEGRQGAERDRGGPGGGAGGPVIRRGPAGRSPTGGYSTAMTSISTRASFGSRAAWMVERAGAGAAKNPA